MIRNLCVFMPPAIIFLLIVARHGVINVCNDLCACCANKDETGTDNRACKNVDSEYLLKKKKKSSSPCLDLESNLGQLLSLDCQRISLLETTESRPRSLRSRSRLLSKFVRNGPPNQIVTDGLIDLSDTQVVLLLFWW